MKPENIQLLAPLFQILGKNEVKEVGRLSGFIQRERSFSAAQFLHFLFLKRVRLSVIRLKRFVRTWRSRIYL